MTGFNWPLTLSGGESLAVIATAVVSLGANAVQWMRKRKARPKPLRYNLELIPISFGINVNAGTVPTVAVTLRAINYTNHVLRLDEVRVRFLQITGAAPLNEITVVDSYVIEPKQSREVICRRNLIDEEARQVRRATVTLRQGDAAGTMFLGRGVAGGRSVCYCPGATFAVHGTIEGATTTV
jgi:hypothetical protein